MHFDSSDWCYAVHCLSERMKKSGCRKQHRRWPYGLRAYPKLAKPKPNTGHADEMAIKLTAANLEAGPNTRATRMVLQLRGAESNQAEKPERERHPVRPPHGRGCLARRCNPIRFFHSFPAAQALVGHSVSKLRSHTKCNTTIVQPLHYNRSIPTLARLPNATVTMYAADHLPPHFHVRMNDGRETLVEIATLTPLTGRIANA